MHALQVRGYKRPLPHKKLEKPIGIGRFADASSGGIEDSLFNWVVLALPVCLFIQTGALF